MMEEISLETSPKNVMIQQDMINSENSINTTESTNTNTFQIFCQIGIDLLSWKILGKLMLLSGGGGGGG